MKTIKVITLIDLLNKIANEEEVPEKIRCFGIIWEFDKNENNYYDKDGDSLNDIRLIGNLNETAEIIEEENIKIDKYKLFIDEKDAYTYIYNKLIEVVDVVNEMRVNKG